jgi:hypothetical protein
MSTFSVVSITENNPEYLVTAESKRLLDSSECNSMLIVAFPFVQYWLQEQPVVQLTALYHLKKVSLGVDIDFAVIENSVAFTDWLGGVDCGVEQLLGVVQQQFTVPLLSTAKPLPLLTVSIPKPWGREIWYTGIEKRGVAGVGTANSHTALPYVLSTMPSLLTRGRQQSLILLKILDPLPAPILGDLYFELHEEKREVYIVTAVDSKAWPDGKGAIRFGFCQQKRQQFTDDASFRRSFAEAIKHYEDVRRQIDVVIDGYRKTEGYGCNEPVSADIQATWMTAVPESLQLQEKAFRDEMESFTSKLALEVSDVVKVPCLTPHSLQHGVRTVEFQTPVYERLILSFAQKVLTQDHWDTDKAVSLMNLEGGSQEPLELLVQNDYALIERIVDFEDFEVQRVKLEAGAEFNLDAPSSYALVMVVAGELQLGAQLITSEQAVLIPNSWRSEQLINSSTDQAVFLLAYPK